MKGTLIGAVFAFLFFNTLLLLTILKKIDEHAELSDAVWGEQLEAIRPEPPRLN